MAHGRESSNLSFGTNYNKALSCSFTAAQGFFCHHPGLIGIKPVDNESFHLDFLERRVRYYVEDILRISKINLISISKGKNYALS